MSVVGIIDIIIDHLSHVVHMGGNNKGELH